MALWGFVKEIGLRAGVRARQHGGMPDLLWDDVKDFFDPDLMGALPDVCVGRGPRTPPPPHLPPGTPERNGVRPPPPAGFEPRQLRLAARSRLSAGCSEHRPGVAR
ncbi:hypothetical protein GCM10025734_04090 [Kitasatospora paranensis]